METINNMAASAAKAVWGESQPTTEEPVSGRVGDTSKGEPYDAGNIEPSSDNAGRVASTNDTAESRSTSQLNGEASEPAQFAKTTGTAAESNDTPNNPSTDLKEKSVPEDTSKGQNDTRSPEDPKTNPRSAPTDVNDADEEGVNEAPNLDGPGPKPLVEAKDNKETEDDESKKSSGTGEQYVKSSGLKADGGDFDATNPGAGREADRLMEEKGIHNPTDPSSKDAPAEDGGSPTSGKKSFGQKIKDKLHRH
ncbi:hypothetical protein NPX13_g2451 [Xylaria arbuscula]|uniref:Glycine-rich cell wall structural protein 1 n=1 Tax=Xylaria arbuscula TaxID=114810 RepID=A0A9W8NJR6_9PEZI|nr:hypothetical protein NPX13_g2451 [Xylaria arbuscula]